MVVAIFLLWPRPLADSANLTSVKDTLETSRLSFHAANASGLVAGSSIIKIQTSGFPSTSTTNLFPGDTIKYTATSNTYTVDQIIDADEFSITGTLAAADADPNDEFVVIRSAQHVVTFTTASAIPNGAIRVRIKAPSSNGNNGLPDQDGFDFNSISNTDVSCPADVTGYFDFVAGTATVSGGTGCPSGYHCFECRYSGPGASGQALTMTIGSATKLINPAPSSGHTAGTADTYDFIVENLDANDNIIDSTTGKIAVIESVRVTATVDPRIEFSISGINADTGTYCGVTRTTSSPDTTATAVPLGSLAISSFTDAVQQLTVSTNAVGGYVVTAVENDQLSLQSNTSIEIADTPGDNSLATYAVSDEWSNTATKGFGYSIQNVDAASVPFQYNTATGNCTGTFCARQFPATADGESPQTIMSSSTVADNEDIYVCYRAIVSATQQAGEYENVITYRATATF